MNEKLYLYIYERKKILCLGEIKDKTTLFNNNIEDFCDALKELDIERITNKNCPNIATILRQYVNPKIEMVQLCNINFQWNENKHCFDGLF